MPQNQSIRNFFKPAQPKMKAEAEPARQSSSSNSQTPPISAGSKPENSYPNSNASRSSKQRGYTSSLSPPPSDDPAESPQSSRKDAVLPAAPSGVTSGRVVKSSDDEESDSDDSLPDIFQSANRPPPAQKATPGTPTAPRYKGAQIQLSSPIAIHAKKYKFSLESLVSNAEVHKATEESSKRVKAMLDKKDDEDHMFANEHGANSTKLNGALLEQVVANKEDGGMEKVTRALLRTEATTVETRWYFFNTPEQQANTPRRSFPTSKIPSNWWKELSKAATRNQTFVSGFAEDMVHFGQALPDEIFLWILDEACLEPNDVLRTSYLNTVKESTEQVRRLISPDLVDKMFRDLGGTSTATTVTERIRPNPKLTGEYSSDWANVCSVVRFFTHRPIAKSLQQRTREHIICMLLRMSADYMVFKNVEMLDLIQLTIGRLCLCIDADDWEASCQAICNPIFEGIEQPTLRLQVVDAISAVESRAHELRRRLAMCFFFNNISYAAEHPHAILDLHKFMDRLDESVFDINDKTDYQQLTALVLLLDVAVDDGRNEYLDLTNKSAAECFDQDVDDLVMTIKDVVRGIGSPGAAFISRIEAKEALELVSQRIADTLRSKPKPKKSVFDGIHTKEEDYSGERDKMHKFVSKMKKGPVPVSGQAVTA